MWRRRFPALALWGFVFVAGCSRVSGFNPVEGKVLWRGKPAAGARVIFHPILETPNQLQPSALVEADGSFHLKTWNPGHRGDPADGAPPGEYRATIDWLDFSRKASPPKDKLKGYAEDKLKGRYADPKRSSLQVTVKEGENVLPPFELK